MFGVVPNNPKLPLALLARYGRRGKPARSSVLGYWVSLSFGLRPPQSHPSCLKGLFPIPFRRRGERPRETDLKKSSNT